MSRMHHIAGFSLVQTVSLSLMAADTLAANDLRGEKNRLGQSRGM